MEKKDKKKVLIIDDDFFIRDVYCEALNSNGFDTIMAVNGEDGLKKAAAENPDLILLDITMPIMDGWAVLQKLRESGEYGKKVPIIILTNLSAGNERAIKKIAENEPLYYIVKSSVTPQQVVDKVRRKI